MSTVFSLDRADSCKVVERQVDQRQRMVGPQRADGQERPLPPQQPLNCPRCESLNTKFCYYNNYSLSQPRHFCKACRRYWTQGGTLRNVPVGGGCRKKSRSKSSTAAAGSSSSSSADTSHFSQHHHAQSSGPKSSTAPPPQAMGGVLPIHYRGSVGLLSSLAAIQSSLNYQQDPLGGPPLMNRQGGVGAGNPPGTTNLGFLQGFGAVVNPMISSLNNHTQQPQNTQAFLQDIYPSSGANTSNAAEWSIGSTSSGGPIVNLNGHPYSNIPGYGHPPRNF